MDEGVEKKRAKRFEFMKAAYEGTHGDRSAIFSKIELGQTLGFEDLETMQIARYLRLHKIDSLLTMWRRRRVREGKWTGNNKAFAVLHESLHAAGQGVAVSAKARHYPGSRIMVEGNASAIRNLRSNPARTVGAQAALISHHVRHRLGRRLVTPAGRSGRRISFRKPQAV
jgi:hypothetical protein